MSGTGSTRKEGALWGVDGVDVGGAGVQASSPSFLRVCFFFWGGGSLFFDSLLKLYKPWVGGASSKLAHANPH